MSAVAWANQQVCPYHDEPEERECGLNWRPVPTVCSVFFLLGYRDLTVHVVKQFICLLLTDAGSNPARIMSIRMRC